MWRSLCNREQVDTSNCLLFRDIPEQRCATNSGETTRLFDPVKFFRHVTKPRDVRLVLLTCRWYAVSSFVGCERCRCGDQLYDHCVNILVASTSPVNRVVIDTSVHFTLASPDEVAVPSFPDSTAASQLPPQQHSPSPNSPPPSSAGASVRNSSRPGSTSSYRSAAPRRSSRSAGAHTSQQAHTQAGSSRVQTPRTKHLSPQRNRCQKSFEPLMPPCDSECSPWESGDRSASLAQLELVMSAAKCSSSFDPATSGASPTPARSPPPRQDQKVIASALSPAQQTIESKQQRLQQMRTTMLVRRYELSVLNR